MTDTAWEENERRAEAVIDSVAERFRRLIARVREEGEDLVAEAQEARQR
jgi:hypothetical protein